MVNINIYGLDQYAISYYSKNHEQAIADICETTVDDIRFIATENSIFHQGVEQNSWNIVVEVTLPKEMLQIEKVLAKYLMSTIGELAVNVHVLFRYYDKRHHYAKINKEYPTFITDINLVKKEISDDEIHDELEKAYKDDDDEEEHEHDHHHHHHHHDDEEFDDEDEMDIYLGNAFEGIE